MGERMNSKAKLRVQEISYRCLSRLLRFIVTIAAVLSLSSVAMAWDGTFYGVVGVVDVTDGANFGFRLYGTGPLCGNANNWAYLNAADSNYATYVAAILMAKAQGSSINLYMTRDAATGHCHIGYLQLN